ncbi:hypothetical protein, partial [Rhizobacter sp. Root29]|uniref:hypothetical protein n=1 Tax=Rhizobacter sp. Root29 TaxID=1736511 RepID=UPI001F3BE4C1
MNLFVKSIFISALFSSYEACALDASDFSELEGWTVSAVTAVKEPLIYSGRSRWPNELRTAR